MCNCCLVVVEADLLSMNFQTSSSSLLSPASNPCESWKMKLLPGYVIWSSISCMPLWILVMYVSMEELTTKWVDSPQLLEPDGYPKVLALYLSKKASYTIWVTFQVSIILMVYNWICPLCYTTNFLKNSSLACIGPPNDQNTKIRAVVSLLEDINKVCSLKLIIENRTCA